MQLYDPLACKYRQSDEAHSFPGIGAFLYARFSNKMGPSHLVVFKDLELQNLSVTMVLSQMISSTEE